MKKLFALLLTAVMCLSLVACNSGNPVPPVDDSEHLDGNDVIEVEDTVPAETVALTPELELWMEDLSGEYAALATEAGAPVPESFVLNADGTCTIEGNDYAWGVREYAENYLYLEVFAEAKKVYYIDLWRILPEREFVDQLETQPENYFVLSSMAVVDEDNNVTPVDASFYNMTDVQKIQLTTDNLQDYFEHVEHCVFSYDADGNVRSMTIEFYYLLKEEYTHVIADLSEVVLEQSISDLSQMITVDPANETYTWGEVTDEVVRSNPERNSNWMPWILSNDMVRYGFPCSSIEVDSFPTEEVSFSSLLEVVDIPVGTIYYVPVM